MGKRTGTSAPLIWRCERRETKPSTETAKTIADAFGVSLDYLVGEGKCQLR